MTPEIGCYGLAGHTDVPRDLLDEVRLAKRLGGSAQVCAGRIQDQLDAGADSGVLPTNPGWTTGHGR